MLNALTDYLKAKRAVVTRIAGYAGAGYFVTQHIIDRLEDVRTRVLQERVARDNLRRRFDQNLQDVSFTIMALLPTLAAHILEGMDVESVTQELQSHSRVARALAEQNTPTATSGFSIIESQPEPQPPPGASDARSDSGSVSVISYPEREDGDSAPGLSTSSASLIGPPSIHLSHSSPETSSSSIPSQSLTGSPKSNVGTELSDSFITNSSAVSYGDVAPAHAGGLSPPSPYTRSKPELWKEVKMLTFTRTLTILYSMTLLSLFTHIQLNILGRSKYLQSVLQLAQEENERERWQDSLSIASLFWSGSVESQEPNPDLQEIPPISEENERKFLTLSWWILHVGWKDVGERVRRAVEEVFEGVALKTMLSAADLHRLVNDVRRRVEFEVTFEGTERRINFMSTLLPPTAETLQHVLLQGGVSTRLATRHDSVFMSLLSETRAQLRSGSFEVVLDTCLDRATAILFSGLERNVFGGLSGGWDDPNLPLGPAQEPRVRLAGMLPGLARWGHLALQGLPNELIDGLADVREVEAFSAIIYADYDRLFQ